MKIKHIAIDGNEANVANRVGSNHYAYEILNNLDQITKKRKDIHFTVLLSQPPLPDLPKQRQHWRYRVVGPKPFWTQWALPIHLFVNRFKYDLLFTPGHYAPRISSVPYVSSVMDCAYLKYPEQFNPNDLLQLKNWTDYSVKKAKKVITISEFSKKEIIKHYKKSDHDVVVAYPSFSNVKKATATQTRSFFRKHKISQPYILYLGTLQPRKNLERLVEAYEEFCLSQAFFDLKKKGRNTKKTKKVKTPKLVIAGKIGWLSDDLLKKINESKFSKNIILTGFVPDKFKATLYQKAVCSVLIGLYEGFGIPPLESMANNTIPVVSETTSLPEVVGNAGIKVEPEDIKSIAQGLKEVFNLTAKQKAVYRRKAREQVKKFNWQKSAQIILDELESLL